MNIKAIQEAILHKKPRIHSITNTITINDCANMILAAGGSATMASDPAEAAEMTAACDALVLNLGAVSSLEAMLRAGKRANELSHPIVLDPVAAGATTLRRDACRELMKQLRLTAIRGNAAEIHTLAVLSREKEGKPSHSDKAAWSFVDVEESQSMQKKNLDACRKDAQELSENTGAIVVVSGKADLVADRSTYQMLEGGSALSSRITGSGCMLSELIGTCLAVADEEQGITPWNAVCCAVKWMNQAAMRAEQQTRQAQGGTMTYRMHFIDAITAPPDKYESGGAAAFSHTERDV